MSINRGKRNTTTYISNETRVSSNEYIKDRRKTRRVIEANFFKKSLDYRDYIFSPEGYEGPVVLIYIAAIPYLMGLLVLFFIAEASYEHFMELNLTSYLIIWAIGYEVCAILLLLIIFLAWLKQSTNRWEREQIRNKPHHY